MQDLRVQLHRRRPVVVDAGSEGGLGGIELVRVRRRVVEVVGVVGDAVDVGSVGGSPALGEHRVVLEDEVLGVGSDPGTENFRYV